MRPRRDAEDDRELSRLGYAQELLRRMGGFSSFAVSFSIISVLTGCITAYADAIKPGGPAAFGLGWPLVSAGTMLVALAMAELASAFPTAGALYHWSALLGGPGAGWITASVNIVGQIAIVAAIDFGCANELAPVLGLRGDGARIALLATILASHALVNALSVRLVAVLNDFSATVHVVGVLVIAAALLMLGRAEPVSFLAHPSHQPSGATGFLSGLVLSMFTFTGYDASAHLAEETHDPARRTAWGIITSVAVSAIAGYVLLVAITLAIRDLEAVSSDEHPPLLIMRGALGDTAGRSAMALAIAAMWFCGLSSVTSSSRTLYAFARDGGLPFSRAIGRVNQTTRTPVVAILIATVGPFALVVGTAPLAHAIFDAMAKMATMALYVSYAIPILLGLLARRRGALSRFGPFRLGRLSAPIGWAAVLWALFVLGVCSLPPNQLPAAMLAVVIGALGLVYRAVLYGSFTGPKVTLASLEAAKHKG